MFDNKEFYLFILNQKESTITYFTNQTSCGVEQWFSMLVLETHSSALSVNLSLPQSAPLNKQDLEKKSALLWIHGQWFKTTAIVKL